MTLFPALSTLIPVSLSRTKRSFVTITPLPHASLDTHRTCIYPRSRPTRQASSQFGKTRVCEHERGIAVKPSASFSSYYSLLHMYF
ncbi:hypothetical protein M011DRAFT_467205 [Sporormia fimetaria CBS 119925]|uniref:Uncharacterized protein n=1 Tax=Sporormia fimetaria CBS 119925 TaxID=1340428 RepID=A0A6A6VC75_9PLEO|nr:hypothetical protein M011DRAFT_467205 [Sporormia fimetaria CBS 119925]